MKWEREQWAIFTRWNAIDARYDELAVLLAAHCGI